MAELSLSKDHECLFFTRREFSTPSVGSKILEFNDIWLQLTTDKAVYQRLKL